MTSKEKQTLVNKLKELVEIENVKYIYLKEDSYIDRAVSLGRSNGLLTAINVILTLD